MNEPYIYNRTRIHLTSYNFFFLSPHRSSYGSPVPLISEVDFLARTSTASVRVYFAGMEYGYSFLTSNYRSKRW